MSDFQKLYLSALETLNNFQKNSNPTPGQKKAAQLADAFVKLSEESPEMKYDLNELKELGHINDLNQITSRGIYEINTNIKKLSNVRYTGRFIRMLTEGFERKIVGIYPIISKSLSELRTDVLDNLFSVVLKEMGNRYQNTSINYEIAEQLSDFYENQLKIQQEVTEPSLQVEASYLEEVVVETEAPVAVFEKKKKQSA